MSAKRKAPAGTIEVSGGEVLAAVKGYRELIKTGFPIELSMEWQKALQALRLAATPIEEERTRVAEKYAKRKGKRIVLGEEPGTIVIDDARREAFSKDYAALMNTRHTVRAQPVSRKSIPRKVNGRDIVIAGEVFDLLGPFLVD